MKGIRSRTWRVGCWLALLAVLSALGFGLWWQANWGLTQAKLDAMIRDWLPLESTRAEVEAWIGSLPNTNGWSDGNRQLHVTIEEANVDLLFPGRLRVTFYFDVYGGLSGYEVEPF